MSNLRETPASIEAEQGLLCSAFIDLRRTMEICAELGITSGHFFYPTNATYFALLSEYWMDNEPIEDVGFQQILRDRGSFAKLGGKIKGEQLHGAPYFTAIRIYVETSWNAENYAKIVWEKFILREVIRITSTATGSAYDQQDDIPGLLSGTVDSMMKIVRLAEGQRIKQRTMQDLAVRFTARIEERLSPEWRVEMPTGIRALDKACLGFKAGTVTMLVGKPSDGKSSLAMNIAEHLAMDMGKKVGIISLDDTDDEVFDRLVQQRARVNLFELEATGKMPREDREAMQQAAVEYAHASDRLFIRDDGAMSPAEINATFANWKAKQGLDFGIIDHIQLARGDGTTRGGTEEANQVSRSLKPMAKRFNIPLLVLSQTTEVEKGVFRTKNTTSLQEDANRLWMIKRVEDSTDAFINIGKQKNGPKSVVPVKYEQAFTRFSDRDCEPEQQELVNIPPAKRRK